MKVLNFIKEKFDDFIVHQEYQRELKSMDWKVHKDTQMDILFGNVLD